MSKVIYVLLLLAMYEYSAVRSARAQAAAPTNWQAELQPYIQKFAETMQKKFPKFTLDDLRPPGVRIQVMLKGPEQPAYLRYSGLVGGELYVWHQPFVPGTLAVSAPVDVSSLSFKDPVGPTPEATLELSIAASTARNSLMHFKLDKSEIWLGIVNIDVPAKKHGHSKH